MKKTLLVSIALLAARLAAQPSPPSAGSLTVDRTTGAIVGPVSAATFAAGNGFTIAPFPNSFLANSTITIAGHVVALGGAQTLSAADLTDGTTGSGSIVLGTSPTLTAPNIASIVNTGTLTLPTSTDTLIGRATTDTLTNKSISGAANTLSAIPGSALNAASVANTALANSTIAIAGASTALGGSITLDAIDNGLAANGLIARTAANTRAARTITGTTNRVSLTNGDGVLGNPTIDIAATYAGQSSITTVGTIATGIWNGTPITNANLGNSTITVGSTPIALGGSATSLAGLNSITAASATDFVANGGSSGASLTLGQGANANATVTPRGTGYTILNGDVGIGTTNPGQKLDVQSASGGTGFNLKSSADDAVAIIDAITGFTPNIRLRVNGTDKWVISDDSSDSDKLKISTTKNGNTLTVQQGGNVGIGTNTPGSSLQINGGLAVGYNASQAAPTNGVIIGGTTASTSTTTGSLINAGGLGNAGSAYIGGNLTVSGTGTSSFAGKVNFPASTTAAASINLPHGSAPTSPTNGDLWTTTSGVYAQVNGATVGPFGSGGGGTTITTATVTSQFDKTTDAALADVPGLLIPVSSGSKYVFHAVLFVTAGSSGGVQVAVNGPAMTTIAYNGTTNNASGSLASANATAVGTAVGKQTSTSVRTVIDGTCTPSASGNVTIQFAQNVSNGTTSSVLVGSFMEAHTY